MILSSPEEFGLSLAGRIRRLRLDQGWSQKEMADRSGVKFATYQLFELTGRISLERLYRLAVALRRGHEFDGLFQPLPVRSIEELAPKPLRKRGRKVP